MIFKLHYWFLTAGANAIGILLGVFMENYTDASSTEIGMLYMMMPFIGIVFRPMICSRADRMQAHRKYLMICSFSVAVTYLPFVIIPMLGPDVYNVHPRVCFYTLVAFKVLGDAAFGGVVSIGDSLAINYAKRIGTNFSVYRVWGTISWMFFGMITGQINEIWFLPKYVPAFMILILSALLDMFVVYLWPKEYFKMVTHMDEPNEVKVSEENGDQGDGVTKKKKKENAMTKSLMPREMVWAHAKRQLWLLVTFRCMSSDKKVDNDNKEKVKSKQDQFSFKERESMSLKVEEIGKKTQLKILALLIRRDPRIFFYLVLFILAGFTAIALSFLFINLSEICHQGNRCNFSQLGGFLQVSMALAETVLFIYIKQVMDKIGRMNTLSIAFLSAAIRFTFYGTIWFDIDPYFSLVAELLHGIMFGIYVTLMVETGHMFANEVEHLIPELVENQIIDKDANKEALKLSLSATMQAIIANANDGIGRGFGALIYGLIVDNYNYKTLWRCIAAGAFTVFVGIQVANLMDRICKFNYGINSQRKSLSAIVQENGQMNENDRDEKETKYEHVNTNTNCKPA